MRATITDISRIANVSTSTVSHVVNGTRNVSPKTRERVMNAIEQTGYVQNFIAKSLKKSSTNTIGLVVSDITNQFFVDVIHNIDMEARKEGYQVFVSGTDENANREYETIKALCERRVDGIIYSPTRDSESKTTEYLKRVNMPVVTIDRYIGSEFDWVGTENYESTKIIVRHVAKFGHTKIGFIAGFRGINTTEERIEGYKSALTELGCERHEDWIITGDYRNDPVTENLIHLMQGENHPTALIAANNRMIYNLMSCLKKLNLEVPKDMAIAAFGDFEWTDYFEPKLTAMVMPCNEIGSQAYQLLKRRIENPEAAIQQIKLMSKFCIRESCGEKAGKD